MGVKGFMEVEFVVVHVLIGARILTNSVYSVKTESSKFCMLRSIFGP